MPLPIPAYLAWVYGLVVLVGGLMGYAKAKSAPSLIAGIVSTVLLAISGWAMSRNQVWGLQLALILTALLTGLFAYRYLGSSKRAFMPSGLMAVLSLLALQAIWLTARGI